MSSQSKKKRKNSFLNKLSRVFKRNNDRLGGQAEYCRDEEISEKTLIDNSENVMSHNLNQKVVSQTTDESQNSVKSNMSGKEEYTDKALSDMQRDSTNIAIMKSENPNCTINDKNVEHNSKLGADRYLHTKAEFLKENNYSGTSFPPHTQVKIHDSDRAKNLDSKNVILQPYSTNANDTNETHKFLIKETKLISQESSEDSDFSADSTEESFEESSEDENERFIESEKTQKYLKDEYFTKGKYITYFFLGMERQFYNPSDVYSMVQYCNHDTDCEKPEKEGIS